MVEKEIKGIKKEIEKDIAAQSFGLADIFRKRLKEPNATEY